jgi:hypothetical protein
MSQLSPDEMMVPGATTWDVVGLRVMMDIVHNVSEGLVGAYEEMVEPRALRVVGAWVAVQVARDQLEQLVLWRARQEHPKLRAMYGLARAVRAKLRRWVPEARVAGDAWVLWAVQTIVVWLKGYRAILLGAPEDARRLWRGALLEMPERPEE